MGSNVQERLLVEERLKYDNIELAAASNRHRIIIGSAP